MIEINFFERKEKNVLPHFMVLFFFIGVLTIGIYFFMMQGIYTRQNEQNNQILQQRSEEIAQSREMEQIDNLTTQNSQAILTLENAQYPIVYLTEDLASIILNDEEVVVNFQILETNEVFIQLDNSLINDSSALIDELESVPYITRVQLDRLEQQPEEEQNFIIDLTLDIDEGLLRQEAAE